MKKVLSVLLAAAMVLGMSVTSMAKDWEWSGPSADTGLSASVIELAPVVEIYNADGVKVDWENEGVGLTGLQPGYNLYFPMLDLRTEYISGAEWVVSEESTAPTTATAPTKNGVELDAVEYAIAGDYIRTGTDGKWESGSAIKWETKVTETSFEVYDGMIDEDWSINIKGDEYVVKASFVTYDKNGDFSSAAIDMKAGRDKFIEVQLVDDLDSTSTVKVDFTMYIADHEFKKEISNKVTVKGAILGNDTIEYVDFDFTNDAEAAATWVVAKNDKGEAIFDFNDDTYFTVKMVSEEKVTLNLSKAYDKAVDALFDYEADLSFYNFKGTKDAFTKTGELFIPADEDTFIYEVVDGELVEVEATWTDEYTVSDVNKEYEGYVIETKELGYYVVSDIEAEIEVEAEEPAEEPVEADKANPETGAADFVGAAVAMAVVSVAAAGALALKK